MEYVIFQGSRLPVYVEGNLRALDRIRLHEHALLLSRTLGARIVGPMPEVHVDLLAWVLRVQRTHLEPLRRGSKSQSPSRPAGQMGDLHAKAHSAHAAAHQASMDVIGALQAENKALSHRVALLEDLVRELSAERLADRALDYVLFEGTRLPLLVESHLRTLDRIRLREHAELLYQSLSGRVTEPDLDGDLTGWILQVQSKHLAPLKSSSSTTYRDGLGDTVKTKSSVDIFGDRKTTTTVQDPFGDTTKTTTMSDPYGDKVTTNTSTDIFGDKTTTRTTRDALGDTTRSSTFTDPYGDKVTTKSSTDIFGNRSSTRTARDALGDTTKTTTVSDAYGDKVTTKTSTDIFGDRKTETTVRDAFGDTYKTSTYELPLDVVHFEGTRFPFFVEGHLRALERARLREHAQLLYRSLSGRVREPDLDGDLVDWILQVQVRHLEPLRTPAERALEEYVLFQGTRLPFFVENKLRVLDRVRLREHAQLLYQSLGARIQAPVPALDDDLADWILGVQRLHLEPLRTSSTYCAANGDIVQTSTVSDAYGDKTTTKTSTDIFGDKTTTRTTRDALGDTTRSSTFTDAYGDKVKSRTSTDIFGNRSSTRTARDALGDTTKTTTVSDRYGDKVTTKTSTDIFGDRKTTRSTRDMFGDTSKTTTTSDPYGNRVTTRSAKDLLGDRQSSTTVTDRFGDRWKTSSASDALGNRTITSSYSTGGGLGGGVSPLRGRISR